MSRHSTHATPSSFWRLWGWPLVLGVLTAVGLVSALFSDGGAGDMLAWITLGIPVVVGVWHGWCRRGDRVHAPD